MNQKFQLPRFFFDVPECIPDKLHGPFWGIPGSGVIGDTIVPVFIGLPGDHFGLRAGMIFIYLTLACMPGIALF